MNNSDTLSVDPGRITLGELHPESNNKFIRIKALRYPYEKKQSNSKRALNFFFAINAFRANGKALAMLILRLALGALLIVSGCLILSAEINAPIDYINPEVFAIMEIVAGSMLALGLLTRIAMGLATIGFGIIATVSVVNGIFNMEAFMSCMACMVFLIFGSGNYSSDFIWRKAIIIKSARKRKKIRENRITYKAFRYASHG